MYCNGTEISQIPIQLDGLIYSCGNMTVEVACSRATQNLNKCFSGTMECDVEDVFDNGIVYCTNATLVTNTSVVCNSTISIPNIDETLTILSCYEGQLPELMAAFIPTTTTEAPGPATTEKEYSIGAIVHILMMYAIGKSSDLEAITTTTAEPPIDVSSEPPLIDEKLAWIPEALTLSPEVTTAALSADKGFFIYLSTGERMWVPDDSDDSYERLENQRQMQEKHNRLNP